MNVQRIHVTATSIAVVQTEVSLDGWCNQRSLSTRSLHCPSQLYLSMQATFIFSIPYTAEYLPSTLSYPVHLWVNSERSMVRLDVDSDEYVSGVNTWGLDSSITRDGSLWFRTPQVNHYTCLVSGAAERVGSASTGVANVLNSMSKGHSIGNGRKLLQDDFPGFSKWKFDSDVVWRGLKAEKWKYQHKVNTSPCRVHILHYLKKALLLWMGLSHFWSNLPQTHREHAQTFNQIPYCASWIHASTALAPAPV